MDYRFTDVYSRMSNLESGMSLYSSTFTYDANGNITAVEYTTDTPEDVLIEYAYDAAGDISQVTGKLDAVLQYTQTFTFNADGDISATTVV